jgi:hypothetical protein
MTYVLNLTQEHQLPSKETQCFRFVRIYSYSTECLLFPVPAHGKHLSLISLPRSVYANETEVSSVVEYILKYLSALRNITVRSKYEVKTSSASELALRMVSVQHRGQVSKTMNIIP